MIPIFAKLRRFVHWFHIVPHQHGRPKEIPEEEVDQTGQRGRDTMQSQGIQRPKRSPNKLKKIKPSTPHSPLLSRGLTLLGRVRRRLTRKKSSASLSRAGLGIVVTAPLEQAGSSDAPDQEAEAVPQRPGEASRASSTEIHCVATLKDGRHMTARSPKQAENRKLRALHPSPPSSESGKSKASSGRKSIGNSDPVAAYSDGATDDPQAAANMIDAAGMSPVVEPNAATAAPPDLAIQHARTIVPERSAHSSFQLLGIRPTDDRAALPSQLRSSGITQGAWNKEKMQYVDARHQPQNVFDVREPEPGTVTGPTDIQSAAFEKYVADRARRDMLAMEGLRRLHAQKPTAGQLVSGAKEEEEADEVHGLLEQRGGSPQNGQVLPTGSACADPGMSDDERPDIIAEGEALAQESEKYLRYTPEPFEQLEYQGERRPPLALAYEHAASAREGAEEPRTELLEARLPHLMPYRPGDSLEGSTSELPEVVLEKYTAYSPKSAHGSEDIVVGPRRPRQDS
ncbi:hypothetical protein LTR85_005657 [Meristemomyces frigidus]|nr:hypothetical protein LTR85_005657 [Meristemomyces frigidus]